MLERNSGWVGGIAAAIGVLMVAHSAITLIAMICEHALRSIPGSMYPPGTQTMGLGIASTGAILIVVGVYAGRQK